MKNFVIFTSSNLGSEERGNIIDGFCQCCLNFQAKVIGLTVTQSMKYIGELLASI